MSTFATTEAFRVEEDWGFRKSFRMTFANGYGVSVVIGKGTYCDQGATTAEVAVLAPSGKVHRMPGESDDVIGHMTPEQVLSLMNTVAAF